MNPKPVVTVQVMEMDKEAHRSREDVVIAGYSEHLGCFRFLFLNGSVLKKNFCICEVI